MGVGIFRGGCLTGPSHSGVELHGFLSYLLKVALSGRPYTVYGYKGKQVRDNIHSFDVVCAFEEFARNPRPGEVYNLGGGRANSISMLEAIAQIETLTGRKINWTYSDQARKGDHICYISNLAKLKSHYPAWSLTRSLDSILDEMIVAEREHSQRVGT
jgi:CDP-paratose 2-epimerase